MHKMVRAKPAHKKDAVKLYHVVDSALEKLEPYRVYSYKELGLDGDNSSVRSAISRSKVPGLRSAGRGLFYKSAVHDAPSENEKGKNSIALKRGKIAAKKLRLSRNFFWSNPDGMIPVDNAIAIVLKDGGLDDVQAIAHHFGQLRVGKVLMQQFDPGDSRFKRIAHVLNI